ncbi:MAG: UxaA family hydrolase, partial [Gammaproteobacteria bacterium]
MNEAPINFSKNSAVIVRLHEQDNVAIAMAPLAAAKSIENYNLTTAAEIPRGHKIALREIKAGEHIRKYGQIIGAASQDIRAGDHVHTQNLSMADFERDYAYS